MLPPRLLSVVVTDIQIDASWTEDDGFGDPWIGFPYRWQVTFDVTSQTHSSHRTPTPFFYDGNDVIVGDWLGFLSGAAVQIVSIVSKTSGTVVAICEDIDRFNIFADFSQQGTGIGGSGAAFVFQLSDEGIPVLAPMSAFASTLNQNVAWQLDQISRFSYRNLVRSYFRVEQVGHTFVVGDVIRITSAGVYEKVTAGSTVEGVVGVVNSVGSPGVNWFTYRPSSRVVTNITPLLPGNPGSLIYLDNSGAYTATKPNAYAKPIFIRLTGNGSIGLQLDRNIDVAPQTTGYIAQTYVVDTIAQRDALTGINDGDQVKVRDTGNGEWRQYIWDNGAWRLVVTQDASNTDAETDELTVLNEGTYALATISSGSRVTLITVIVEEAFPSSASLVVGTSAMPSILMSNALVDLSTPGTYSATPAEVFDGGGDTEIVATLTTNAPGRAVIGITYT